MEQCRGALFGTIVANGDGVGLVSWQDALNLSLGQEVGWDGFERQRGWKGVVANLGKVTAMMF